MAAAFSTLSTPSRSWGLTIPASTTSFLARALASNSTGNVTNWNSNNSENAAAPTRNTTTPTEPIPIPIRIRPMNMPHVPIGLPNCTAGTIALRK